MLDITEHRKLESELAQAQKLESVGRLAAGIAHEINTPVQFVSDSIQFVKEGTQDLAKLIVKYRALHDDDTARPSPETIADIRQTEDDVGANFEAADAASLHRVEHRIVVMPTVHPIERSIVNCLHSVFD